MPAACYVSRMQTRASRHPLDTPAAIPSAPVLILAPVRGVTDAVYREAFAVCFGGFAGAVAPFIQLRQGQGLRPGELRQVAPEHNRALRTIPQLLTHHPATLAAALRELHGQGHAEANLNLGCPYPMVAKRGRGSGLLPHPDRIDALLGEAVDSSPVRLSVKMRLGYADPDEFRAVLAVLNRHPLTQVILHARTAAQMYEGAVDLDRAAAAQALCRHPFVYNGDIAAACGLRSLEQRLPGTAAWMIGRGALADPFLPAEILGAPAPAPEDRRRRLREFHDRLHEGYGRWLSGPGHLLDKMKEQWEYLARAFADPRRVHARIRRVRDAAAYAETVAWAFDQPVRAFPAR